MLNKNCWWLDSKPGPLVSVEATVPQPLPHVCPSFDSLLLFYKNACVWIRTVDPWHWKQPLIQLCHNHLRLQLTHGYGAMEYYRPRCIQTSLVTFGCTGNVGRYGFKIVYFYQVVPEPHAVWVAQKEREIWIVSGTERHNIKIMKASFGPDRFWLSQSCVYTDAF